MIRELKLGKDKDKDSCEKEWTTMKCWGDGQGFLKTDITRKHYISLKNPLQIASFVLGYIYYMFVSVKSS